MLINPLVIATVTIAVAFIAYKCKFDISLILLVLIPTILASFTVANVVNWFRTL